MKFVVIAFLLLSWTNTFVEPHSAMYTFEEEGEGVDVRIQTMKKVIPKGASGALKDLDEKLSRCGSSSMDIRELTITQAQAYFQNRQLSSQVLTECYLRRIKMMDKYLKSVIEINPDAIKIATEADAEREKGGKPLSPIHGIPILIKDNLGTLDQMQTTVGAVVMEWIKPRRDSDVVKLLREAGAVILGKTNPSEWAYFRGTGLPSGWSGRGGQTLSPYVLTGDPSGSSTGSAVSMAANLGLVSIGTETDGSIIGPSGINSLVGLKPTLKLVSTNGVIPLAFSQDVVGPMTRTVLDAAILLDAITSDGKQQNYATNLQAGNKKKFRIGIVRNPFWNSTDSTIVKLIPSLDRALDGIKKSGQVTVIDQIRGKNELLKVISPSSIRTVFSHEFKFGINNYLKDSNVFHLEVAHGRRKVNDLADIIDFNVKHPPSEGYNQNRLLSGQATDGLKNQTYLMFQRQNKQNAQKYINSVLQANNLDALTGPCDTDKTMPLLSLGAMAGYPQITVPAGIIAGDRMPVGICFLGQANSESVLLQIGALVEKAFPKRALPKFLI